MLVVRLVAMLEIVRVPWWTTALPMETLHQFLDGMTAARRQISGEVELHIDDELELVMLCLFG